MIVVVNLPQSRILRVLLVLGVILLAIGLWISWDTINHELAKNIIPIEARLELSSERHENMFNSVNTLGSPFRESTKAHVLTENQYLSGNCNAIAGSPQGCSAQSIVSVSGEIPPDSTEEMTSTPTPPAIFNANNQCDLGDIPKEVIEAVAREFVDKVKQGGWDNTTKNYRSNWEKAAEEADEAFKAAYGYDAYLKLTSGGTN